MRRRGSRPRSAGRWSVGLPNGPTRCGCGSNAPLVVATLGGTGTGKSALVNALLGAEVVQTGRSRPTTTRPTLVCRPGLTPEMLGIDPASVEWIERDLPALRDLVLVDCPDPDTTEEERGEGREEREDGREIRRNPSPLSPLLRSLRATTCAAAGDLAEVRRAAGDGHAAEVSQRPRGRRTGRRGAGAHSGFRANPCRSRCRHPRRLAARAGRGKRRSVGWQRRRGWGGSCTATPRGDSATVAPTNSCKGTSPFARTAAHPHLPHRLASGAGRCSGQLAAAGRVRRSGRSAHPANGQRGRQPHSPGELPRSGRRHARYVRARASTRGCRASAKHARHRGAAGSAGQAACRRKCRPNCWRTGGSGRIACWARPPRAGDSAPSRWCCEPIKESAGCLPGRCSTVPGRRRKWPCGARSRACAPGGGISRIAAPSAASIGAAGWEPAELRKATLIVEGYVVEAGLDRRDGPSRRDVAGRSGDGRRRLCRSGVGRSRIAHHPAGQAAHRLVHALALRNSAGR